MAPLRIRSFSMHFNVYLNVRLKENLEEQFIFCRRRLNIGEFQSPLVKDDDLSEDIP